jgi:hypothetical protein
MQGTHPNAFPDCVTVAEEWQAGLSTSLDRLLTGIDLILFE